MAARRAMPEAAPRAVHLESGSLSAPEPADGYRALAVRPSLVLVLQDPFPGGVIPLALAAVALAALGLVAPLPWAIVVLGALVVAALLHLTLSLVWSWRSRRARFVLEDDRLVVSTSAFRTGVALDASTAGRVEVEQGALDTWLGVRLGQGFCVALGARDGERLVLGRTADEASARFVAAQLAARHATRREEVRVVSFGELLGALPPRIRVHGDVASAGSAPWMLEIRSSRRGLVAALFASVFCALVGGGLVSLPWTMHLRPGDDPFEAYGLFLPLGLAFFAGALAAAREFVMLAFGATRVVLGPDGIDTITLPLGQSAWRPVPRWRHGEVKARALRENEPPSAAVSVVMEDGRDLAAGLALDLAEAEILRAVIARYYGEREG